MRKKSTSARETQSSGRQTVYHRGNQRDGSPHYVFLYPDDDQSEDEEHFSLQPKNSSTLPRKIEVINVQVQSEDTLQALALRYHCKISELKRINNIHKDNEIHAHRLIKVPVQPYSLLTEPAEQKNLIHENGQPHLSANQSETAVQDLVDLENLCKLNASSSAVEINTIILNSTIQPLLNDESSEYTNETETDQLIFSPENGTTKSNDYVVNTFTCSGADWGLSWFQLICFFLLLGFAGPIIYVLYIAESSDKHHDSTQLTDEIMNTSEKL